MSNQALAQSIEKNKQATVDTQYLNQTSRQDVDIYKGVGSTISDNMTVEEMVEVAGLNWQVYTSPIKYGDRFEHESSYRKAIYREDTGKLLDTVGSSWQPFQNLRIVETFNTFCRDNALAIDHLGSLDQGRCVFATAFLNEQFSIFGCDDITSKILLTNYHKQGYGLKIDLMAIRLVCKNGMTLPVRVGSKVISHVGFYDNQKVSQTLAGAKNNFKQYQQQSEVLAQTPIDDAQAVMLLINSFGVPGLPLEEQPKVVQTCFNLFKGEGQGSELLSAYQTAWGLLNSVTEYTCHKSQIRGGMETHLSSLWMGSKGNKQNSFMNQLVSVYIG